jgi:2-dehydro-3-deoxygluconokinase
VKPVVLLGEPLAGFIADDLGPLADSSRFRAEVVGAEINAASALARLGVPAVLIARTGTDELGEMVIRHAQREGIGTAHLRRVDLPTGLLIRSRRGFGAASVVYRRSGSAGSSLERADVRAAAGDIAGAGWLHVSGVTAALSDSCREAIDEALELARAASVPISLDLNYRARLWSPDAASATLASFAARADVTISGLAEGRVLTGAGTAAELVAALRSWGAHEVVVTCGPEGACHDADGVVVTRPARSVAAVADEVGAGDAFAAGFIAGRLRGLTPAGCLDWGAVVAAFCIGVIGDAHGLPTPTEVERILAGDAETIR